MKGIKITTLERGYCINCNEPITRGETVDWIHSNTNNYCCKNPRSHNATVATHRSSMAVRSK